MNKNGLPKPPLKQAAFTLLELIIVIVILGIVAVYVQSKFQDSDSYQLDATVEQLISAGRLTQQLAMNDVDRNFVLEISSNQINISATPASPSLEGIPVNLGTDITLSPASNIVFNGLGETTATTITVTVSNAVDVCFESTGFIHRC